MEKNVLIYSNNNPQSLKLKEELITKIKATDIRIVDENEAPDFIISIGGDGTLLSAFHEFKHYVNSTRFIGIHTGHLGFYTDWQNFELDEVIEGIRQSKGESVSYPLLKVEMTLTDNSTKNDLALNEFSVRSFKGTMVCEVYIKEHFFETFRGDGICISTPTGSTGLNKALGGAVIHPRLDAIQLTEMASVNNRVYRTLSSSMIIPRDEWFVLHLTDEEDDRSISIDNMSFNHMPVKMIRLQLAAERIRFASFRHMHFWDRVENSFIGRKQGRLQGQPSGSMKYLK
ncbi:NAD kinase [Aerococcaceae bacterium WS4759]|uniref:NAD kinase n=1 Tax=Fundicoccus ignavus TaxID=2664442 RepID=A0A6I2GCZ3_9LACT|nr:NAD kinase [Fundicoccus ignavus]MRI85136.1 NAD kinase [Fundicoccus ignavus]